MLPTKKLAEAWLALAEAYLAQGNKDLARQAYYIKDDLWKAATAGGVSQDYPKQDSFHPGEDRPA